MIKVKCPSFTTILVSLSLSLSKESEIVDTLIKPPTKFGMLNRLYTDVKHYTILNHELSNHEQGSYHAS